ncbi:MAG: DUF1328 domain-containing protein [Bdellovibrionota bacterium]
MLRVALVFFILAIVALIFGATGLGGFTPELAKSSLIVFLILSGLAFTAGLLTGKDPRHPL